MVTLNNESLHKMSDKDKPKFRRTIKSVKSRHYAMDDLKSRGGVSKLNNDIIKKLNSAISKGHHPKIACASVNVGYETFLRWLKKGATDYTRMTEMLEKGMSLVDQDYSLEYDLYENIQQALFHSHDTPLEALKQAIADGDWKASAHFLERRFPNEWGKKTEKTIDKHVTGQLETQTIVMVPRQASNMDEWNEAVAAYKGGDLEYLPAPNAETDKDEDEIDTKNVDNLVGN